jgi:vacuolar iron transporter family protein
LGARLGRAPTLPATIRVLLGGAAAMGLTAAIGALFGFASP